VTFQLSGGVLMTTHIKHIKDFIRSKKHHCLRKDTSLSEISVEFRTRGLSPMQRMSERFVRRLREEDAVVFPFERIAMTRTVRGDPDIFTEVERAEKSVGMWSVSNINPGYEEVIKNGLGYYRDKAVECLKLNSLTSEQNEFYTAVVADIDAIFELCGRYHKKAQEVGNETITDLFEKLPRCGAKTFHEALQMFRILHFMLWVEGEIHNTVGRFDQFMYPYFKQDIDCGLLTEDEAFELLEEFFLTFNRDSDLYRGVQQGDNGQSMVLGGVDENGDSCFNKLSEFCLIASKELALIDPKINLRVDRNTPQRVYELGTELTKVGLGFPQYNNDDIVIPGLVDLGYELADARNYVVAACWEFIIPRYGMEIPNIDALVFPKVIDICMKRHLADAKTFDSFMDCVKEEIEIECDRMIEISKSITIPPAPYISIFMGDCMEKGADISLGTKYNNYGFHGVGISTATDSLAAIRQLVFEHKSITASQLIKAVDTDFVGYDELLKELREDMPKMGDNEDYVDDIAVMLMDYFAESLRGKQNNRGGIFRAGTGSAMFYIWSAAEIGASPDGRKKNEPFSANYAPSLFSRISGPLSVIQSFIKPNLRKVINGGPLTMEFHESLFKDEGSIQKIASLVSYFIKKGGHQFQLNSINRVALREAQKCPELYPNLIVRVWGWSAYFVELDEEYQNHILSRQAYT